MRNRSALCLFLLAVFCLVATSAARAQDQAGGGDEGRRLAPTRVRVGGNIEQASLTYRVVPVYPAAAKEAGISGTVLLHVLIGKDGSVEKVEYVSGPTVLMQSAMDAVKQWRYKPLLLNHQPVEVDTAVEVVYTLNQGSAAPASDTPKQPSANPASQGQTPSEPAAAASSQEPYVYEAVRGSMQYEDDGTGSIETYARIRVQSFAGVQQLGQLIFEYNSDNERLDIRSIRVTKPNGQVIVAGADAVQDLTAPVAQVAPVYTDARQKHITVPGLSAGDLLEYEVVKTEFKPIAPGQFWYAWDFVSNGYCLDESVELDIPANRSLKIKSPSGLEATITEQGGRRIYHWDTSNHTPLIGDVPVPGVSTGFDPTKLLEGAKHAEPKQLFFSTFQSWNDVGHWYAELERDRRVATPALQAKAEELVKGEKTDADKANAIYSYVSRNIRYVSLSFGVGRYQPHAAADVFSNEYGDCKDKATLLGAMLDAAGIKSSTALINSDHDIDEEVPAPLQFDHAITVASIDGKDVWLDSTLGVGPYAYLLPQLRGKHALVVNTADSSGEIRETPASLTSHRLYKVSAEGKVEKGTTDLDVSFDLQGDDLEVLLRLGLLRLTPETLAQMMTASARQAGNATVTDVKTSDPFDTRNPLHIEAHFSETKSGSETGDSTSKPAISSASGLPVAELLGYVLPAVPTGDASKTAISLGTPKDIYLHLKIESEDPITAASLKPIHLEDSFAVFDWAATWQNNTLTADFHVAVLADEVPAEKIAEYADFRKSVADAFTKASESKAGSSVAMTQPGSNGSQPAEPGVDQVYSNAISALNAGSPTSAAEMLETVVTKDPNYKGAWNDLGRAYMRLREFDKATTAFQKAIELNPSEPYAYNNLGLVYLQQKKYAQATPEFQKQIEINSRDRYAHGNLGRTYLAMARFDDAAKELEIASGITPDDPAIQLLLGRAYVGAGQEQKAVAAFGQATTLSPTAGMLNDSAYDLADAGMGLDQAEKYAKSALTSAEQETLNSSIDHLTLEDLGRTNEVGMFWDTMGWVKFREGDSNTAMKYLRAAWMLKDDGVIADHLGQVSEKEGKKQDAIDYYELALATNNPPDATRGRLAALLGKSADADTDAKIAQARTRLAQRRTMTIANQQLAGEADFAELMAPGEEKSEIKFAPGDDTLQALSDEIAAVQAAGTFPNDDEMKIVRRGRVSCTSEAAQCTVVFAAAESAASVF